MVVAAAAVAVILQNFKSLSSGSKGVLVDDGDDHDSSSQSQTVCNSSDGTAAPSSSKLAVDFSTNQGRSEVGKGVATCWVLGQGY